jgi:hypothetical protein
MAGHGEKLTRKQEAAIAALLACPTVDQAAEKVGVNSRTLWRWMQNQEFQAAYREARQDALREVVVQLRNACTDAVKTLTEIMAGEYESTPASRVTAAKTVLEYAFKAAVEEDLAERITVLEQAVSESKRGGR